MFRTPKGVVSVPADIFCFATDQVKLPPLPQSDGVDEKWAPNPDFPEQVILIGGTLPPLIESHLKQLILSYIDVFAFQHVDMTGVPREFSEHKLRLNENAKPIVQKR